VTFAHVCSLAVRWSAAGLGVVGAVGLALGVGGCPSAGSPHGAFDATAYEGVYGGTWFNNDTGASGAAQIEIAMDEVVRSATLSLDFDEN
jgi:hypothetical protein